VAIVVGVAAKLSGPNFLVVSATGFSTVSVPPECIAKDYEARWVLQVRRVEAAALCGGRISLRLPLRTAAATPLRGEIRRLTRGMTSK